MKKTLCAVVVAMLMCASAYPGTQTKKAKKAQPKAAASAAQKGEVPVTTSSAKAKQAFEEGVALRENLHLEHSVAKWREAVKLDPNFSQAWAYLAWVTRDPVEAKHARERAKATMLHASKGEQLLVTWMTARDEGDSLKAISAMNDLLAMYPRDKRVLFQAARWLFFQGQYEQSAQMADRALAVDPNYLTALNSGAYAYAELRNFDKAIEYLKKYSELAPEEPNPHDSLGEIYRLAQRYPESIEEYNKALAIDPKFESSLRGLGDTYAWMGDETKAREEYAKAIAIAPTDKDRLDYEIQSAISYLREGNNDEATAQFKKVDDEAHKLKLGDYEATAHRDMALYMSDPQKAVAELVAGETELNTPGHDVSKTDHDEQYARTLFVHVMKAIDAKDMADAAAANAKLAKLAEGNRNQIVQSSMHSANGLLLAAEGKTDEAISELQEDPTNVYAQKQLIDLYTKKGDTANAEAARKQLAGDNEVFIEEALVVPGLRKS